MEAVNLEKRGARGSTFKVSREDVEELDWYIASVVGLGS